MEKPYLDKINPMYINENKPLYIDETSDAFFENFWGDKNVWQIVPLDDSRSESKSD